MLIKFCIILNSCCHFLFEAPIEVETPWSNSKSAMSNGKAMPSPTSDAHRRRDPHTALPSIPSNTPNPLINGGRRSLPRQPDNGKFWSLRIWLEEEFEDGVERFKHYRVRGYVQS